MRAGAYGVLPEDSSVTFRDITHKAGIHFVHNNAAFGKKYLPETMGPGVAFIDYDNDGWPDIFLVNGMDWPGHAAKAHHAEAVSQQSRRHVYGCDAQGRAGRGDVRHGRGGGRLRQRWLRRFVRDGDGAKPPVSQQWQRNVHRRNAKSRAWRAQREFSTSAAWVDYDRDGKLDLVVGNYVQWSIGE